MKTGGSRRRAKKTPKKQKKKAATVEQVRDVETPFISNRSGLVVAKLNSIECAAMNYSVQVRIW